MPVNQDNQALQDHQEIQAHLAHLDEMEALEILAQLARVVKGEHLDSLEQLGPSELLVLMGSLDPWEHKVPWDQLDCPERRVQQVEPVQQDRLVIKDQLD
jgi:hypothetical protein